MHNEENHSKTFPFPSFCWKVPQFVDPKKCNFQLTPGTIISVRLKWAFETSILFCFSFISWFNVHILFYIFLMIVLFPHWIDLFWNSLYTQHGRSIWPGFMIEILSIPLKELRRKRREMHYPLLSDELSWFCLHFGPSQKAYLYLAEFKRFASGCFVESWSRLAASLGSWSRLVASWESWSRLVASWGLDLFWLLYGALISSGCFMESWSLLVASWSVDLFWLHHAVSM